MEVRWYCAFSNKLVSYMENTFDFSLSTCITVRLCYRKTSVNPKAQYVRKVWPYICNAFKKFQDWLHIDQIIQRLFLHLISSFYVAFSQFHTSLGTGVQVNKHILVWLNSNIIEFCCHTRFYVIYRQLPLHIQFQLGK